MVFYVHNIAQHLFKFIWATEIIYTRFSSLSNQKAVTYCTMNAKIPVYAIQKSAANVCTRRHTVCYTQTRETCTSISVSVCKHYQHTGSYALQYSTVSYYGLHPPTPPHPLQLSRLCFSSIQRQKEESMGEYDGSGVVCGVSGSDHRPS